MYTNQKRTQALYYTNDITGDINEENYDVIYLAHWRPVNGYFFIAFTLKTSLFHILCNMFFYQVRTEKKKFAI